MKPVSLPSRFVLSLFVVFTLVSGLALAFGYKVVAFRNNPIAPRLVAPPVQQSSPTASSASVQADEPIVQEFFRSKRLPAGESLLSEERYASARQQIRAREEASAETTSRLTWQRLGAGEGVAQSWANAKFYSGALAADGNTFIGGTASHGVVRGAIRQRHHNNEGDWEQLQSGLGTAVAVDRHDANVLFYSQGGALHRSTNGGRTFTKISPETKDTGLFVTPFVVDALTSQRIWFGTTAVWRTQDGGTTWQQASPHFSDKISALSYAESDHNFVLAGTRVGTIYRLHSGLASTAEEAWPSVTPRAGYVSSIVVDAQNPNVVYATYATFGGAHVWRSEDAGATWQSLDGTGANALPDVPVHTLVMDPRNAKRLFIGTDLGVFTTTDGGKTWTSEAAALGGAIVESLVLQTTDNDVKLFAFTYGNGVWQTNLNLEAECTYSVSTSNNPSALGGQFSLFLSTSSDCGWTATSNVSWVTITSASAGKGSASISYSVAVNPEPAPRTGTLLVGGQVVTITQSGLAAGCEVKPIKAGETLPGTVKVGTCTPINNPGTTFYNATYFTFEANRGDQIALNFQGEFEPDLRLFAPGTSQSYSSTLRTMRVPSTGFLTVSTSGTHLVEISNYLSARGNFTLSLIAPTSSTGCGAFSLSNNAQSFEASGGTATVELSGGATCPWTVRSNATWITTPTTTGTGNGQVSFTVAANTTATTRTGTIDLGGQSFTVTQAGTNGTCASSVLRVGQTVGGTLSTGDCLSRYNFDGNSPRPSDLYTFTATEGQRIMIAANSPQMSLQLHLADQNGTSVTPFGFRAPLGSGYVTIPATGTYTLEVTTMISSSPSRIGSYSLSLLSAASGCGYVLPSMVGFKQFEAEGGAGTIEVTSGNGCGWVATTHDDWIKINTPTGVSSGKVEFSLTPNTTGRSRIGSILVSGQSIFFEQAATGGTCLPSPITPGQPVRGSLDISDCLSTYDIDAYATDRYSFSATAGQQVRVDVNPTTNANLRVYLLEANNRLIQRGNVSFPTGNGFFTLPTSGSYILEIANLASSGSVPYTATLTLADAGCNYTAAAVSNYFEAAGAEGSIDLTGGNNCVWQASTGASWITLARTNGNGSGHVNFTVAPNTTATFRSAVINVAGQALTINQAGTSGGCVEQPLSAGQTVTGRFTTGDCRSRVVTSTSTLYADRYSFSGTEGQQILLGLRTSATTATMYLTDGAGQILTSSTSRIPGTSGYFRLPATGVYFVEVVSSFTQDYTLNFALLPSGCNVAFTPDLTAIEATGGNGSLRIIAGPECPWTIADLPIWVTFSANSGTGSATVNFTVAPNTTNARRRATLAIGGQTHTIEQPGAIGTCNTTALTAGQTVRGTLGAADCRPDLQENLRPITDRYSFTGTAGSQVALAITPELISGFLPTVSLMLLDPAGIVYVRGDQRLPRLGFITLPADGTYTLEVTSNSASSTTNVNYALTLETTASRCNFTVTPSNNLFEVAGGSGSINVQTTGNAEPGTCAWNVSGVPAWVTISEGTSGTGNGTINYRLAENTTTSSREATLIVAGQAVRLEQAGRGGNCGVTPLTFGQAATGTTGSYDCRARFRTSASSFSGYYARQFSFNFTAGQQFALTATQTAGSSFTPYLYLYDDKGNLVAQGENRLPAGTGSLSLATTGIYFVELTSRDTFFSSYGWSLNLSAPTACVISLLPDTTSFAEQGGTINLGVVTGTDCPWTAQSDVNWLTFSAGSSSAGNGQLKVSVANNPSSSSRRGTLTIGGQTVSIEQTGNGGTGGLPALTFGQTIAGNLFPADYTANYSFYTGYVDRYGFEASAGQQLALSFATNSSSSFPDQAMRLFGPNGNEIALSNSNPGVLWTRLPLSGRYRVELISRFTTDYRLNAELVSAHCNFVVRPAEQTLEPSGGSASLEIVGPPDCAWSVERIPDWLTVAMTRAQGTNRVEFTASPNLSSSSRTVDLFVAGQTARVQQLGAGGTCAVRPISVGQTVRGTISGQDCRKPSFSNNYHRYSLTATAGEALAIINPNAQRVSLLSAAGTTLLTATTTRLPEGTSYFTVPASGTYFIDVEWTTSPPNYSLSLVAATPGCNYVLSATRQGFEVQGGSGVVNVLSPSGCEWTASSDASWITMNTERGTGNADVSFTVTANTSVNLRRANLTIAGQTFVVEQAGIGGSCSSLPLLPNQIILGSTGSTDCQSRKLYTFDAVAGQQVQLLLNNLTGSSLSLAALAPNGAPLAQTSGSSLTILPSAGSYLTLPTTGTYTVAVTSSSARSDYQLSLQLVANTCRFDVVNPSLPFPAAGGNGAAEVTSNSGCGWTALSLSSWLQVKTASGSGTGKVEYTLAPNTNSSSRTGSFVVAGRTFTIEQAGTGASCQVTPLSPGQFLASTLTSSDCRSRVTTNSNPAKWFSFTGTAGDQLLVRFAGAFAPTLSVLNAAGTVLRTGRGETLPNTSGFYTLPASGEYWIEVTSESSSSAGNFRISFITAAPGCGFNLSTTQQQFETSGGTGQFEVSANGTCQWYAYSDANWITVSGGGGGAGNAPVNYTVAANTTGLSRLGRIFVNDQTYLIEQAGTGGSCQSIPLKLGETITGTVTEADCRTIIKPSNPNVFVQRADLYAFTGQAGDRIVVTAAPQGTNFAPQLSLFGPNRQLLRQGDRIPSSTGSYTLPANGTYLLEVSTTGGYSVRVEQR